MRPNDEDCNSSIKSDTNRNNAPENGSLFLYLTTSHTTIARPALLLTLRSKVSRRTCFETLLDPPCPDPDPPLVPEVLLLANVDPDPAVEAGAEMAGEEDPEGSESWRCSDVSLLTVESRSFPSWELSEREEEEEEEEVEVEEVCWGLVGSESGVAGVEMGLRAVTWSISSKYFKNALTRHGDST